MRDDGGVSAPSIAVGPKVRLLSLIAATALLIDIVVKTVSVSALEGEEPIKIFGGLLNLVLVRNPGAAWSLGADYTWVISLIVIVVVGVIIRVARRLRSTGWAVALGLVLGGALGNLVDRIFRSPGPLRGAVVDMFSLVEPDGSFFPVFNTADMAVTSGGVLLVILALTGRELDGTRTGRKSDADAAPAVADEASDTPGPEKKDSD